MLAVRPEPQDPQAEQIAEWLLGWSALEPRPRAVIDGDRTLRWRNRAAADFLARGRDLTLRGGAVEPVDARKTEPFAAFIRDAGSSVTAWCLPRADGDGDVLFRAWRISAPEAPVMVGLLFHSTGREFTPLWADLQTIFKLTAAEAQVTRLLLDGLTAEKIAERLGVSLETVRSHIRRAYAKTGVSSREEMFRRMAPYRLV